MKVRKPFAALAVVALAACGGAATRAPNEAPAWRREMERLRAQHFLDHALDGAGQDRLSLLLDFGAGDAAQADQVDRERGTGAALRGVALRAWEAREPERFLEAAVDALRAEPADPGAAAVLARALDAFGDHAAGEQALAASLDELAPRMHPDATWLARLYQLQVARRGKRAGDVAALEDALGFPKVWRVSGPWGALAARDLERPLPPESGESSAPGVARVDRPAPTGEFVADLLPPGGGVVYAEAACRTEAAWTGELRVFGDTGLRAFIDGVPLTGADPWRSAPGAAPVAGVALAPGWHRLLVKVAADSPGSRVAVRLTASDGRPPCAEWAPAVPAGQVTAGARLVPRGRPALDALTARAETDPRALREAWALAASPLGGDPDAAVVIADRWTSSWPDHAPGWFARGMSALADAELPPPMRQARAGAAWRAALVRRPDDPTALVALARIDIADGQRDAALERLDRARAVAPRDPGVARARFDALLAERRLAEARGALEELARLGAATGTTERALRLAEAEDDLAAIGPLRARLADEAATLQPDVVAQGMLADGDLEGATRLYARLADERPDQPMFLRALVSLAEAGDDRPALEAAAERLLALYPRDDRVRYALGAARFAAGDRDGAKAAWQAIASGGNAPFPAAHEALAQLSNIDFEDLFELDGRRVLEDWRAWKPSADLAASFSDAGRVEVLDQWVAVVHPDGGVHHLTHRITLARSREAADSIGELRLPEGARLLQVRTLRGDGTEVESEGDHGKGETSFSRLGEGDAVDYRYIAYDPPVLGDRGTAVAFVFRLDDAPVFRSDFTLLVPEGMQVTLEPRNGAPAQEKSTWNGYTLYRWRAEGVPPLPTEPDPVPVSESAARVSLHWGVDPAGVGRRALRAMLPSLRPGRVLDAALAEVPATADPRARVQALFTLVRDRVRLSDPGSLSLPASHALTGGRGDRAVALRALLGRAGFESEVLLAHRRDAADDPTPDDEPGYYDLPVVRVTLPEGELWLDPSAPRAPFAHLDPALLGAPALAIEREPVAVVHLPDASPAVAGWTADLDLAARGDALEGTLTLEGIGASTTVARQSLPTVPIERYPALFERLLGGALPGVRVGDVALRLGDPDAPARITLAVTLPLRDLGAGRRGLPGFLTRPITAEIGGTRRPADYLTLERRETPMLVRASDETVRVRLSLPPQWRIASGWDSFALEGPIGAMRQTVTRGGNGQNGLVLERQTSLRIGRVLPADHPSFARWARATVEATDRSLVLVPGDEGD